MATEVQPQDSSAEKLNQGSPSPEQADLMAELRKAEMRVEAYSNLDDPYGANRVAQEQNRQKAEAIRQQLAGEQLDEHSEAA